MSDNVSKLKALFDDAVSQYSRDHKRIKLLQDADGGDLWKALASKFPKYQILTDSNWVRYIKSNITASLYTVTKSADVIPTSDSDRDICVNLSAALEHIWDTQRIGYYEFLAGNNAALTNLGLTQVVWDSDKRRVKLENVNPLEFMRDPYSDSLDNAGWCCRYGTYHKNVLKENPKYADKMEEYLNKNLGPTGYAPQQSWKPNIGSSKDHFLVTTFWVRENNGDISETTLVNMQYELFHNKAIKPNCFPIVELYCNIPDSRLIGVSEPASIFANNVAYNLMRSNMFTAEYKNQRPPKFIRTDSGLNIADFAAHGDQADRTFVVSNNVKDAVMYHEFPKPSPELDRALMGLVNDMQEITGVDPRYTGRDTGSIITTGGTQEMLNRVSMIDAPKVMNYEAYVNKLSLVILKFLFEFSPTRVYYISNQGLNNVKEVKVEYEYLKNNNIDPEQFDYTIQVSSELPKNKQRVQAWADRMMEKQMQYRQNGGSNINLITEEEWLEFQSDIPYKERILERMGVQRGINAVLEASEVVQQYAQALENGMMEDEALLQSAEALQAMRDPKAQMGGSVPADDSGLAYLDDEDELTNFGE